MAPDDTVIATTVNSQGQLFDAGAARPLFRTPGLAWYDITTDAG